MAEKNSDTDDTQPGSSPTLSDMAQKIVEDGEKIKEQVDGLVQDTVKAGRSGIDELTKIADEVIKGVAVGVSSISAEDRSKRIEEAFAGLESAFGQTLMAVSLALKEAAGRGEKFANEDLARALEDLKTIEKLLVETIAQVGKNSSAELSSQMSLLEQHAKRMAENLRPSINDLLVAIKNQPAQLAEIAVGTFAKTLSSVLRKASDALDPDKKK